MKLLSDILGLIALAFGGSGFSGRELPYPRPQDPPFTPKAHGKANRTKRRHPSGILKHGPRTAQPAGYYSQDKQAKHIHPRHIREIAA